jgi:Calcineurin-like phosphoesterase
MSFTRSPADIRTVAGMKRSVFVGSVAAVLLLAMPGAALAGNGTPINVGSANPLTLAVFGDAPYGANNADTAAFDATPAFVDAVNHDPKVDLVAHVGDIHSGSQRCTVAYDRSIADLWTAFKDPLVYTPGDNEWTDCQKTKELPGSDFGGDPLQNLAAVRSIFFPRAGYTLGGRAKRVLSQAQVGSGTDSGYVENVLWEQSQTLFVTLNLPGGSNNDADNWYGLPRTQTQTDEISQRTQADLDWLSQAFAQADADGVGSVVVLEQADMWDLDGKTPAHIAGYRPFIDSIAANTLAFGKPVLLFNGDSHAYRSDNPLVPDAPCVTETGAPDTSTQPCADDAYANQAANGGTYDVPNFHRIVVHGGTTYPAQPLEYLRFTDDPRADNPTSSTSFGPFSWERAQP